ncbi:MAG: ABC transporter permease [Acidobacteria bacterium]|nr:ABC transporter permease [Acidobacteriota bacterium]
MSRMLALLGKELSELRRNPALVVPAVIAGGLSMLLPFIVAIIVPAATGERLSESSDLEIALEMYGDHPALRGLDPEAAVQAWIFQQFLVLLVLTPVAGAMSVAAYSIVGEKQARTLEPLLATPLTTFELLVAKVCGAFVPALVLTAATFLVYAGGVMMFAQPGAVRALLLPRSLAVTFVLGPLAALAALQLAVCVSSRVNDARSAQQIGALVVLPVTAAFILQITGMFQLTGPVMAAAALVLVGVNAALMLLGIRLFQRESILTRWK